MALPRVRLETLSLPLRELLPRPGWNVDHLDLAPPYQRGSVWTAVQRANLVRSLIEGLPIGAFFLNDRGDGGPRRVVDGKQRIEALRSFRAGVVPVPAAWWERYDLAPAAAGLAPEMPVTATHLSLVGRRRIFETQVALYVSHLPTVEHETLLYDRVNYAGTPPPDRGTLAWRTGPPAGPPPASPSG